MYFIRLIAQKPCRIALFVLFIFISTPFPATGQIAIVAHQYSEAPTLTQQEVANLFLGIGQPFPQLTPYDHNDPRLRKQFYRLIAGLSITSVRAHWAKQVFSGRGRPPAILATAQVSRILRNELGAVTYVPLDQLSDNFKVLLILESGDTE